MKHEVTSGGPRGHFRFLITPPPEGLERRVRCHFEGLGIDITDLEYGTPGSPP
jgi:hypothetical protein